MKNKISRREMLKDVGVVGTSSLLAARAGGPAALHAAPNAAPAGEADLARLSAGDLEISFDRRYGSIHSIMQKGDPLGTNFIGNEETAPGADPSNSRWTGDVVASVFDVREPDSVMANWTPETQLVLRGRWRPESTGCSADIRQTSFDAGTFSVTYKGASANEEGLKSFSVVSKFHAGEGRSLLWDVELQNTRDQVLEIGELGFPLMVNDNQGPLWLDPATGEPWADDTTEYPLRYPAFYFDMYYKKFPEIQRIYHEEKVMVHPFVAGHSSYALVQRPLGNPPFLLFHTMEDTAFECVYSDRSSFASRVYRWRGPSIFAVHSWAAKNERRWRRNPWVNGHTTLVLQPGEKRSYHMRFALVDSYDAIREELYKTGNLGIRILPSMVVQEETDAIVEVKSKSDIGKIEHLSDNITVKEKKRAGEKTLLTLSFKGRGQKSLKLNYGAGRWTNLHFYCIEDIEQLLKARGRFIVEREFYENPDDPYHRHHMFVPFDHRIGSIFLEADQVWETGGSDEYGFSEALFVAEKNVYYPSEKEIATLETYVADCLFKYIQDPKTYDIHASLYWVERTPSSPWSHWTKERAMTTFRAYNYPHVVNIYHALYKIGKRYGLAKWKTPEEYLKMACRTCLRWFQTEPWGHVGVMLGANALEVLEDIKKEGWEEERKNLYEAIKKCNDVFVKDPYPYASEFPVDTTAHEQVYFFTRYFGNTEKNRKTIQVTAALRGGNQPVWFKYGNDNKRDLACWYTMSTNAWALLRGFEDIGEVDTLIKGYAGLMSVQANMLPDGMGYGSFNSSPGDLDFSARTLDNGVGQYAFFKAAKSYVIRDESLGLVGFGCRVESSGNTIRVYPKDGLKKRVLFVEPKVDLEAAQGEFDQVALDGNGRLELQMSDSTGLVKKAEVEVKGLAPGNYRVRYGSSSSSTRVSDSLTLAIPIAQAKMIQIQKV